MIDSGSFAHAPGVAADDQSPASAERQKRIEAHGYLCKRAARRFVRRGLERSDLEQVAAIGLIKAADRYRPSMKTPFEAFAWSLVLGELLHFVRDHERIVRLPRALAKLARDAESVCGELRSRLHREPSDGEIARELHVDVAILRDARRAARARAALSLDSGDVLITARCERVLARGADAFEVADRLNVDLAVAALPPIARAVVLGLHVFGFKRTELAERLGLTPRRLGRINDKALAELARSMTQAA